MNVPLQSDAFETPKPRAFADLDLVRTLHPVTTDEGEEVPVGTRGTVVAIYAEGQAYEVEFALGLATIEGDLLEAA